MSAPVPLDLDLVADLAEPLAEYMLTDYECEVFQDSPVIEAVARVAALMMAAGREVPFAIRDVLRKAAECGQPVGVA